MVSDKIRKQIEAIDDLETLENWLKEKPVELSQLISLRSALRILPLLQEEFQAKGDDPETLTLMTFRAIFISWAARTWAAHDMRIAAATAASSAARSAARSAAFSAAASSASSAAASSASSASARSAAFSASAASSAATAASSASAASSAASSASAAARSATFSTSAAYSADIWDFVNQDLLIWEDVERGNSKADILFDTPIWPEGLPKWVYDQKDKLIESLGERDRNWMVWYCWYENVAFNWDNKYPNISHLSEEKQLELAMKPNEFWDRTPAEINEEIASWLGEEKADAGDQKTIAQFILDYLSERGADATIDEIRTAFADANYFIVDKSMRGQLSRLAQEGQIERVRKGVYRLPLADSEIDDENNSPEIPEQESGLTFEINSKGEIDLARSGKPSENDIDEIKALRDVLLDALDDLTHATQGSNAYAAIAGVAGKYRQELNADQEDISVDRIYAFGVRLENANARIASEIASGDYPEMAVQVGEALDSVIALHGPMIISTDRGAKLIRRWRAYNRNPAEDEAYKELGIEFASKVADTENIATQETKEVLVATNLEINEGPQPERSTELGRTTNNNFLKTSAKIVVSAAALGVTTLAVTNSAPGILAAEAGTALINALWHFFLVNSENLRGLAAVSGQDLSWLNAYLNWLERQNARKSD